MKLIPNWIKNIFKRESVTLDISLDESLDETDKVIGMCKCTDSTIKMKNVQYIEYAPLTDGCHTHFMIGNCKKCGGVVGDENLNLFLEKGKEPFIIDVKRTWRI